MPTVLTNFNTANNRLTLTGTGYDNAGNQTATNLGESLIYDANNRQTSYTVSGATTNYHYDPGGNRVKKVTPTKTDKPLRPTHPGQPAPAGLH